MSFAFTTRNKLKANKENEELEMLSEVLTFLTAASITEAALEDLENNSACLENMVEKAEAEELSIEDIIKLGFVHGYKHAIINSLTEEDE